MCDGSGKYVNPSIVSGGLTQEDFDQDPEFRQDYFSGVYDITCEQCHGNNVIPVVNEKALSDEEKKMYYAWLEDEQDRLAEEAEDRRTRFYESGGYF